MKEKLAKTQRRLIEEFSEINVALAEEIDIKIKAKVLSYQSDSINGDVSVLLREEIKKYVRSKNDEEIRKKCNKLANEYLENNRIWVLQENWFCLLAYIVMIVTMFLRFFEIEQEYNDWFLFVVHIAVLVSWIIIVKSKRLMGKKAYSFLVAFNHQAPSIIIVSSLLFYIAVCFCSYRIVWVVIIVLSIIACVSFTWLWYKREINE